MEDLKITSYADSVSELPDNPSDAGYTPDEIKRIFDSRTDNEVKEKHNKTVDALIEIDSLVKTLNNLVETHETKLSSIETNQTEFESSLNSLIENMDEIKNTISKINASVSGVTERVLYLENNSATKDELAEVSKQSPIKGVDYWTEEDVAEIKSYVDEAILGGAW